MKFVDNMYNLYKDQLVGDEEDALIIVSGLLEELERSHLMELIDEMDDYEMFEMLGNYLVYKLRVKMAEEGIGHNNMEIETDGEIH